MIKKIKVLFILILCAACNSPAQKNSNSKAIKLFQENLEIIERSFNGDYVDSSKLTKAIEVVEGVTRLKSYVEDSDYDSSKIPVSYNIQDWQSWLHLNSKQLRFDEENKKMFIEDSIIMPAKNPTQLFSDYLDKLSEMKKDEHCLVQEANYIGDKLEKLTTVKSIRYSRDYGCRFPTSEQIKELNEWFIENKSKMMWDKQNQEIKLSN